MKNPAEAYKEIRSQIFEALEPDAINAMSSDQLATQLKQAVELLIEKINCLYRLPLDINM